MRKWMTVVVTAGVLSTGVGGLATPAQAGKDIVEGGGVHMSQDEPVKAETIEAIQQEVATARAAANLRTVTWKAELREKYNSYFECVAEGYGFGEDRNVLRNSDTEKTKIANYKQVVGKAEAIYAEAAENADKTYVMTIQNLIGTKANDPALTDKIYYIYAAYKATYKKIAAYYIQAVAHSETYDEVAADCIRKLTFNK